MTKSFKLLAMALGLSALCAGQASAVTYWLVAKEFTQAMPDGSMVPMWGFAIDDNPNTAGVNEEGPASAPGPELVVPAGNQNLIVRLRNALPVPVSLTIPGLRSVWNNGGGTEVNRTIPTFVRADGSVYTGNRAPGDTTSRMRSAATEVPPGGSLNFRWDDIRNNPGTLIYRSATQPQVQVQMGLYGAVTKDSPGGEAYPGYPYTGGALLQFSEIDIDLHEAVALAMVDPTAPGAYGTPEFSSTINYKPEYYLVNGQPYSAVIGDQLSGFAAGDRVLVRMVNHGLTALTPMLLNRRLDVVAEDGEPYVFARDQYSALLAAGKTKDALFTTNGAAQYALLDRRLHASNPNGVGGGGTVGGGAGGGGGNQSPVAVADAFSIVAGNPLTVAAPGVLANDTDADGDTLTALLDANPLSGALALAANGGFTYTPNAGFFGADQFSYIASDGIVGGAPTAVSITVENDAPTAANDPTLANDVAYCVRRRTSATNPNQGRMALKILANDLDTAPGGFPAGSTIAIVGGPSAATAAAGAWIEVRNGAPHDVRYYPPLDPGAQDPALTTDSFQYTVTDAAGAVSNVATVTLRIVVNRAADCAL